MIGIYLPLPQSQMNRSRVAFLKRLVFQYDTDLHLFQAHIAPFPQHEIDQLGIRFETVDAFLKIRESDLEIYTDDHEAPVRFVIQEAPDHHEQLQWTVFLA